MHMNELIYLNSYILHFISYMLINKLDYVQDAYLSPKMIQRELPAVEKGLKISF